MLPFGIGGFNVPQPGTEAVWVHVQVRGEARGVAANVTLADVAGAVVAETTELQLRAADPEALRRANAEAPADAFYRLVWRAAPAGWGERWTSETASWIVVATAGSASARTLAASLGHCTLTEPSGLATALTRAPTPAGVVFLWEARAYKDAAAGAHRAADEGLAVVQALRNRAPVPWWVTTRSNGC